MSDFPTHAQGYKPPVAANVAAVARASLTQVDHSLSRADALGFVDLFVEGGGWRDAMLYTGDWRSIMLPQMLRVAEAALPRVQTTNFELTSSKLSPMGPDVTFLVYTFAFTTSLGPAFGSATLVYQESTADWRIYSLFTMLDGLEKHPTRAGANRVKGHPNIRLGTEASGPASGSSDDPRVLIIGSGHMGLSVAAQLKSMGICSVVVEKNARVGDNWRNRYRGLHLHDPTYFCHLPFLPFPSTYPEYMSAKQMGDFLEAYANLLGLNVWTNSDVDPEHSHFDESSKQWTVTVNRPGARETVTVAKIVFAAGWGMPEIPKINGLDTFGGIAIHSSTYFDNSVAVDGKRVLVVGTGSSGHDISSSVLAQGAEIVTMLQRGPTMVNSAYTYRDMIIAPLYGDGPGKPPIEIADALFQATPRPHQKLGLRRAARAMRMRDQDLRDRLVNRGFRTWWDKDDAPFWSFLPNGGGYYHNTGASELIADGKIGVKAGFVSSLEAGGLTVGFSDGSQEPFDVVIFATGYGSFDRAVGGVLGGDWGRKTLAGRGRDDDGEIMGMNGKPTGIPRVDIMMGALGQSRNYSKIVALKTALEIDGDYVQSE